MQRKNWLPLATLILLTVVIYGPVYHYGFIRYDDASYVESNPHLRDRFTASQIYWALNTYRMGNWNPMIWASFFLDRLIFGVTPGPMHVENALLHLIAGVLLLRFLELTTGDWGRSFVVAALFVCHPMHVESVAWISERKDVLSTPLLLAAMIAYVYYTRADSRAHRVRAYVLLLLFYALSLMSKSMGVTLPAALLLLDYWPMQRWPGRSWKTLVLEKLPVFLLSFGSMFLAGLAQKTVGAAASLQEVTLGQRLENAIVCYVVYIAKLAVPAGLSIFYPHPGWRSPATVIGAAALLLLLSFWFWTLRRTVPALLIGWFWFLGTLVPVIGLVQIGGQAMADRYSYFPSIGLFITAVWGVRRWLKVRRINQLTTVVVISIFTMLAVAQVSYWRDSESLFGHALKVDKDNPVAHVIFAQIAFGKHDINRAVDECNLALKNGDNPEAYFGLGNCWALDPDHRKKAIEYFRKAIAIYPQPLDFHVALARSLRLDGQLDEARKEVQIALRTDSSDPGALNELHQLEVQTTGRQK